MRARTGDAIILVLCYLILLEGLSWWMASWPFPCLIPQEHHSQSADHNNQKDCPTFGSGIWILSSASIEIIKRDDNDKAIVAAFTIVLAISTIGLWIATVRLWRAGEDATKRQTRDTEILQRAYLAIDPHGIDPLGYIGLSAAHISIRNVGNIPARDVSWFLDVRFSQDGRLNDFPIEEANFYGKNVIPPGTVMRRTQFFPASKTETIDFGNDKLVLYVWGLIRYLDGFGNPRFTRFCHRYSHRGLIFQSNIWSVSAESMRYHQFGNDAD